MYFAGSKVVIANETTYCVAKDGADEKILLAALDWVCGQPKTCYEPNTPAAHASYAFNEYYQHYGMLPGTCDFKGNARITTANPGHGACIFHYFSYSEVSPAASSLQFRCCGAVILFSFILLLL
ncbi:hypothetical protein MKW94_029270 [Papaver nudicaule]|uniref:X8 domain-containing protein n=1 Tax=Papaver nudicaule TaxID=74823 RepID=A0AA41UZJ5_PAPNU|nr:hypothetical protein [Papaver nudicaule]